MPTAVRSTTIPTDIELIRRMAEGDESAAAILYDRCGRVAYALAYRITGNSADAEEVVMDAFAQAWRDAPRFETGRGSVTAWVAIMARSRALDLLRARGRRLRLATEAAGEEPDRSPAMGTSAPLPDEAVALGERRAQVLGALERLSPPQRQAIELAYYDGLSQSEIAERLQEPLGTIKTRVRLGMLKLREALEPHFFEQAQ